MYSRLWEVLPNTITSIRILGSPLLILLAYLDQPVWFAVWTLFLIFTEWLDGFVARKLQVTSAIGARLDTVADAVFYVALTVAITTYRPEVIRRESLWIAATIVSYCGSWAASWLKFRRLPSYHTYAAKGVWVLVVAGIIVLLMAENPWLFRAAMVSVTLANIEAIGITLVLSGCRVDVPSYWHARRMEKMALQKESTSE